jgi:hypothetical protein
MLANLTDIKSIKDSLFNKQLTFDQASGRTNFDMHKLYQEAYRIYGSDPSFNQAWLLLNDYTKSNLEKWDSTSGLAARLANAKNINEKILGFVETYENATTMSDRYARITTDPEWANVRRQYYDALGIDAKSNPNDVQLGSNREVIDKMEEGYAKEEMRYLYKHSFMEVYMILIIQLSLIVFNYFS